MKKYKEKDSSKDFTDDYTLPDNADIYYDSTEDVKKRSHIMPVAGVLLVIIALAGVVTFVNIPFMRPVKSAVGGALDSITEFFGVNESKNRIQSILAENGMEKETNVMPFENATIAQYSIVNESVVIASSNYIASYSKKGEIEWETATSVSEPILDTNGEYIAIADKGGVGICLYHKRKLVYSSQTENDILTMDLSAEGDVVVTTDKEYSKGGVEVFNKKGRRVFSWTSGTEYVMGASISDSKRRIAVNLLSAENQVASHIHFFDINNTEPYYKSHITNSAVMGMEFIDTTLDVTADNCIAGLKLDGDTKWMFEYKERELLSYRIDDRGNKIVSCEIDAVPYVHVFADGGKKLAEVELEAAAQHIDIKGRTVIYNEGRSIFFGSLGNEKKYTASMDVKNLRILNSDTFLIVYNNSIEFINI